VNLKRVRRLYREQNLMVRRRKRKKVGPGERQPLVRPARANEVWSMDFVFDRLASGRSLKEWRRDYNERRPKKQLGGLPPGIYAARMAAQLNGADSNANCY